MKDSDRLKLLNDELMKEIDTTGYKYFGTLQDDQIRHREIGKWKGNISEE